MLNKNVVAGFTPKVLNYIEIWRCLSAFSANAVDTNPASKIKSFSKSISDGYHNKKIKKNKPILTSSDEEMKSTKNLHQIKLPSKLGDLVSFF